MPFTGILSIDDNQEESRLDGTLLAVQGSQDPLGDATAFLENKPLASGDTISVTGTSGTFAGLDVIFMIDAAKVATAAANGALATAAAAVATKKATRRKVTARAPQKTSAKAKRTRSKRALAKKATT